MSTLSAFVKTFLIPGSLPFLILGVTAGVVPLYLSDKRARKWGRRWLVALSLGYWVLSIPLTADLLSRGLTSGYAPLQSAGEARGATAIVLLTGGVSTYRQGNSEITAIPRATAMRTLETYRLYTLLGEPPIVVSGGNPEPRDPPEAEAVGKELIRLGVARDRVLLEPKSRNSREHALFLPPLLQRHAIDRFVLVTSPTEMRRQLAALESVGLDPIPSVAPEARSAGTRWSVLPSSAALARSRLAVLGYLGLVYYWWNGWIG